MSEDGPQRRRPNILITGTPGVGKTSTASLLAVSFDFELVATKIFLASRPNFFSSLPSSIIKNNVFRYDLLVSYTRNAQVLSM